MIKRVFLVLGLLGLASLLIQLEKTPVSSADSDNLRYRVTVTNLTRGQVLTPTVVAVHNGDFKPLFDEGHSLDNPADPAVRDWRNPVAKITIKRL